MKPHEERVVDEKKELDEKLRKLAIFINGDTFKTLPIREGELLLDQEVCMRRYSDILGERITHFVGFAPKAGAVGGFTD
jgi:hypothetical protein